MQAAEITQAIQWAYTQTIDNGMGQTVPITKESPSYVLVDAVREYFNTNAIAYATYSYKDLQPYL